MDMTEELEAARKSKISTGAKLRTALQGLTFAGADEAEAFIRSLRGEDYEKVLSEVRQQLADYRQAAPLASAGYEVAGAALPTILLGLFTGGVGAAAAASRFPFLARLAGQTLGAPTKGVMQAGAAGLTSGALYGYGSGENSNDRLSKAVTGGVTGAVLGPVFDAAGGATKSAVLGMIDAGRRKFGDRGSKLVETELERILQSSPDLSLDMIIEGIENGNIAAENATLREIVRSYRATGGPAAANLKSAMERRPARLAGEADAAMASRLSNTADENIKRGNQKLQQMAKAAEDQAYAALELIEVDEGLINEAVNAVNRVPSSLGELNEASRALGIPPLFIEDKETGKLVYNKAREAITKKGMSAKEVEIIQRNIGETASARFKAGAGTPGRAMEDVSKGLEKALDAAVPEAQATRRLAASNRNARDAFNQGQRAFSMGADDLEIMFEEVGEQGPEALKALRAGVMQAIRRKLSTAQRTSFLNKLATEGTQERRILEIISDPNDLNSMVNAIERADKSAQASKFVQGGSPTSGTTQAIADQGSNFGASDVIGMMFGGVDAQAGLRLLSNAFKKARPNLTDADRAKVMEVLLSSDPAFVRRMFEDPNMFFQNFADRVLSAGQAGLARAGMIGGAREGTLMGTNQGLMGAF